MFQSSLRLFALCGLLTSIHGIAGPKQANGQVAYYTSPVVNYYRPNPLLRPRTFAAAPLSYGASLPMPVVPRPYVPIVPSVTTAYYGSAISQPLVSTTSYLPPVTTAQYIPTSTYIAPTVSYSPGVSNYSPVSVAPFSSFHSPPIVVQPLYYPVW